MAKPSLVATRGFKYMTRRLLPGDIFEAKNAVEAMILTRVRKVAMDGLAGVSKTAAKPADDMKALRAAYRAKFNKGPGPSWDAATIREKIAEA